MQALGTALLYTAFFATLATGLVSLVGAQTKSIALIRAARHGVTACWLLFLGMSCVLTHALMTHDFSNKYISTYTDLGMPTIYLMTSFWGGEKGALLFWVMVLSSFTMLAMRRNRTQSDVFLGWVTGILMISIFFFTMLMVFESNPFDTFLTSNGPRDGKGLNPLLQNPIMALHPPSLLTGYITFTLPYAFGMAALITGRLDDQWIKDTRKWTLVSWMFLSIGLILGGAWAYQELGWGGFWMWDPVENAGLIPWFTATAYLHSVMIQERREMLKRWNIVLVSLTFLLTVFGTFLTRSQLIDSVHAFADSTLAGYFLWYMAIIAIVSMILIAWRWGPLRSEANIDSLLSREALFVLNNILLVGCAFVVIWGTMFSKVSEAEAFQNGYNRVVDAIGAIGLRLDPMTHGVELGEPWFNRTMTPLGLALLVLTGIGPLISWRRATRKNFEKNFRTPVSWAIAIVVPGTILRVLYNVTRTANDAGISFGDAYTRWAGGLVRMDVFAFLSILFVVFVTLTIAIEFHVGARARQRAAENRDESESYLRALVMLTLRNKRRYGGYIVHMGIVFAFLAFTGNAWRVAQPETVLHPGDRLAVGDYRLTFAGTEEQLDEDAGFAWSRATVLALDKDEVVPRAQVEALLAQLKAAGHTPVQAETQKGSAKVALTFGGVTAGRRFAEEVFLQTWWKRNILIANEKTGQAGVTIRLSETVMKAASVTPGLVHKLSEILKRHFEGTSPTPARVATTPGSPTIELTFDTPEGRAGFLAAVHAARTYEGALMARYNPEVHMVDGAKALARIDVVLNAGLLLLPETRAYVKHETPTTEVAIESKLHHDLYLAMRPAVGQVYINLLAIVFPLVSFLWLGALTIVFGSAICVWPAARLEALPASTPGGRGRREDDDAAPLPARTATAALSSITRTIVWAALMAGTLAILLLGARSAWAAPPAPVSAGEAVTKIAGQMHCACIDHGELVADTAHTLADCPCPAATDVRSKLRQALQDVPPARLADKAVVADKIETVVLANNPEYEKLFRYDEAAYRWFMNDVRCVCGCKGTDGFAQCELNCSYANRYKSALKVWLAAGVTTEELLELYRAEMNSKRGPNEQLTRAALLLHQDAGMAWGVPAIGIGGAMLGLGWMLWRLARRGKGVEVLQAAAVSEGNPQVAGALSDDERRRIREALEDEE